MALVVVRAFDVVQESCELQENALKILLVAIEQVLVYEKDKTTVKTVFRSFLDPLSYTKAIIEANLDSTALEDLLTEQMLAFSEIGSMMDQHLWEPPLEFHVLINFSVEFPFPPSLTPL